MSKYIIQGKTKISGSIKVSGAKNNALKALAACLLTDQPCLLKNVPDIEDIRVMMQIMRQIGCKIEKKNNNSWLINSQTIKTTDLDEKLAHRLRSSIMFVPALLLRFNKVRLPHPGGCVIGKRPIDFFLRAYQAMGANIKVEDTNYYITAKQLQAVEIVFPQISHTGTESVMMAATLAKGETTIVNAACEPEVVALANMLNKMGAKISGAGTSTIKIKGVKKLKGVDFSIIPDRIETGSFIALAAANKQSLEITNCDPSILKVPIELFKQAGVKMKIYKNKIKVLPSKNLKAIKVSTHEYPGFPTDLQAPFTVMLTQASGLSLVHETIYESRLFYTDMLNRMGAHIILCDPHRVIVQGPAKLLGKKVESPDLRAGIAMLIAATIAQGTTEIDNVYQIERGYENIIKRLRKINIDIKKIDN